MDSIFTLATFKHYFISLAVFLVIDMVWLLVIAKNTYSKYLGYLMAPNPNLWAALLFYLIFILGLLFFVIDPALTRESWQFALFAGMFFGLVTYSTYDLTNMATIKDWPAFITVIDLIWGTAVIKRGCGLSGTVTYSCSASVSHRMIMIGAGLGIFPNKAHISKSLIRFT